MADESGQQPAGEAPVVGEQPAGEGAVDVVEQAPASTQPEQNDRAAGKAKKAGFFVYIIESPSAPDLYHGRSEGTLLERAAALDWIPCVTRTAINQEAFIAALRIGLPDAMGQHPDLFPILHISAHGSDSGIQLSSGDVMVWDKLRQLLLPVNKSLSGWLLLCMSACEGHAACRMAMALQADEHPYYALVANSGTPTWSDTAVAYAVFYHLIAKGVGIATAVEAMRSATNDQQWMVELAEELQRTFAEEITKLYLPAAQESLEQAAESPDVPPDAKALEQSHEHGPIMGQSDGK